jgi:hypothetical protein
MINSDVCGMSLCTAILRKTLSLWQIDCKIPFCSEKNKNIIKNRVINVEIVRQIEWNYIGTEPLVKYWIEIS